MKKRLIIVILIMFCLLLTGCNDNTNENNNLNNNTNNNTKQLDHKIYKYVRLLSNNADDLFINLNYMFGYISNVGYSDKDYKPELIVESDTSNGKAKSATLYGFFLDTAPESTWVDEAIEKYNTSNKKDILNVEKGRVDNNVTYIKININTESYNFEQYIRGYILEEQNIEKYNNETFYDNLYNYDPKPVEKKGDNFFENPLTNIRIEWSDSEINAY